MRRTHLSLYYLAGYLVVAGIALIATGQFAMRLLHSNGQYGDALPRLLGVVLLLTSMKYILDRRGSVLP